MLTITEALEKIEGVPQGNARVEALASVADVPGVKELVRFAVDNSVTFGVKKLPGPDANIDGKYNSDVSWAGHLAELLDGLAARDLSGHDAIHAVKVHLSMCSELQRKWAERVLLKDLRLNIGSKEVNRAIPGLCFEFSVPLAVDYKKASERDLRGEWIVQYKYDGARCVAYLYGDGTSRIELKSRTGKAWGNFESVRAALAGWNSGRSGPDLVLDGEVVSLDSTGRPSFNQIQMTMHAKKRGTEVGALQYVVFDYATREQWEGREDAGKYSFRYDNAEELVFALHDDGVDETKVALAPSMGTVTNPTPERLMEFNRAAVEAGYEGAMARLLASPLELKRTKRLLKVKAFSDSEARIVGTVEGTGKLVGMLGTLVCETPAGARFEIGSGYTEAQRAELWGQRNTLVGQDVKYKYFEVSKDGVPRFPIFLTIRDSIDM